MGNDHINFLLVERHPTPWPQREWVMPATEGEQLRHFADWHPAIVEMITAKPVSDRWGLFHRPPLGRWTKGRVTLLGDAAHQLAPHHGQGANQSIEDAVVLADCLGKAGSGPIADAIARYEMLRRGRTRKVQVRVDQHRGHPASPRRRQRRSTQRPARHRSRVRCITLPGSMSSTPAPRCPVSARVAHGCDRYEPSPLTVVVFATSLAAGASATRRPPRRTARR